MIFGYSYGHKPSHALNSSAIVNILLFATKSNSEQSFCLKSLSAGGPAGEKHPVEPDAVRVKPVNGVLFGPGIAFDAAKQVSAQGGQVSSTPGQSKPPLQITFPASRDDPSVSVKPVMGRWDLRQALEVRVQVHNAGQTSVTPRVRVDSNGGATDWMTGEPILPGKEAKLVVPFFRAKPIDLSAKQDGRRFTNDACTPVTIAAARAENERALVVGTRSSAYRLRRNCRRGWANARRWKANGPRRSTRSLTARPSTPPSGTSMPRTTMTSRATSAKTTSWSEEASPDCTMRRSGAFTTTTPRGSRPTIPPAIWTPTANGSSATAISKRG